MEPPWDFMSYSSFNVKTNTGAAKDKTILNFLTFIEHSVKKHFNIIIISNTENVSKMYI